MGGWMNWALNVYPRIRPALNHFYPKLKGRQDLTSLIWVNNNIHEDFTWAVGLLNSSLVIWCKTAYAQMGSIFLIISAINQYLQPILTIF